MQKMHKSIVNTNPDGILVGIFEGGVYGVIHPQQIKSLDLRSKAGRFNTKHTKRRKSSTKYVA